MRHLLRRISITIVVILFGLALSSTVRASGEYCGEAVVIRKEGRSLQERPGLTYKSIALMPYGATVWLLDCDPVLKQEDNGIKFEWVKVETTDGLVGWMALNPEYFQVTMYPADSVKAPEDIPAVTPAPQQESNQVGQEISPPQNSVSVPISNLEFDLVSTLGRLLILTVLAIGLIKFFSRSVGVVITIIMALCCGGDWYINANTHCQPTGGDPMASIIMDLTPLGIFKDIQEVVTGCDAVTGDKLGIWRWTGLILLSEVGDVVRVGLKPVDNIARSALRGTNELVETGVKSLLKNADEGVGALTRFVKYGDCSFSADTLVSTESGLRQISEIEVGDKVLAFDEKAKKVSFYSVIATYVHTETQIVEIGVAEETIETTPEHPFSTKGSYWVEAGDLVRGELLYNARGHFSEVQAIELYPRQQTMYNLAVSQSNTFFVGRSQLLVHNKCPSTILRANLGSTVNDGKQAHHLIPTAHIDHSFVKRAREAGWDNNATYNGILLPREQSQALEMGLPYHRGYHKQYSDAVEERLDILEKQAKIENWTPERARWELLSLAKELDIGIRNMGPMPLQ